MNKNVYLALMIGLVAGASLAREPKLLVNLPEQTRLVEEATAVAVEFACSEAPRVVGLTPRENLELRTADHDGAGVVHVRFETKVRGVRVVGGEVILHLDAHSRRIVGLSNFHRRVDVVEPHPG